MILLTLQFYENEDGIVWQREVICLNSKILVDFTLYWIYAAVAMLEQHSPRKLQKHHSNYSCWFSLSFICFLHFSFSLLCHSLQQNHNWQEISSWISSSCLKSRWQPWLEGPLLRVTWWPAAPVSGLGYLTHGKLMEYITVICSVWGFPL